MADEQSREKETRVPLSAAICTILPVISCICIALRFYTRKVLLRNVAPDDYVIILAQVFGLGMTGINYAMFIAAGVGRHAEFVQDKGIVFLKLIVSAMSIYNATQLLTKISLLMQYGRIFPSRVMQFICNWGIIFLILWGIAQQVFTPFSCLFLPITHIPEKSCLSANTPVTINAVMNMLTDFLILVIPIQPVLQLQVNTLRKVYLLVILCLGLIVCIISAVRLQFLVGPKYNTADIPWEMATVAVLSSVETSLGIVCACVPTLRPLMKRFSPALAGSSNEETSGYGVNVYGQRTRLDDENTAPQKSGDTSIYIRKEVNFHSTTELRTMSNSKDPYAIDDRSSDEISLQHTTIAGSAKP